jgi:hypothetical protein
MANVSAHNRFSFKDQTTRTIHCIVVESPRRCNARAIVATQYGRTMRVPTSMLRQVPAEESPITAERAEELFEMAAKLVTNNRAVQRQKRQRRAEANWALNELLEGRNPFTA